MTAEYTPVSIEFKEEALPDVHLFIPENPQAKEGDRDFGKGMKLDLPNLNSGDLPIDVVQAVLLLKSNVVRTEEQNMAVTSTMLAYFQMMKPDFWNFLRLTGRPLAYLAGTLQAWAEQSGLDPKASFSSLSSTGTAPHWTLTGNDRLEPSGGR